MANKFNPVADERSKLLEALATSLLRSDKFFAPRKSRAFSPAEAEQIGSNSRLRSTWHGRLPSQSDVEIDTWAQSNEV